MARSKRSSPRPKNKPGIRVEDQRKGNQPSKPKAVGKIDPLPRSLEKGDQTIPIRTVIYVELGGVTAAEAKAFMDRAQHSSKNGHPHYVVPLRKNKVTKSLDANTEVDFEAEFLNTVNRLCEVNENGEIVMKNGSHEVDVIRVKV